MKYLFLLLSISIFYYVNGQTADWQPFVREIVIQHADSVERANILVKQPEIKIEDELVYHWFKKDVIHRNMGGYTGHLLQGEYLVFNNDRKMITKGQYVVGLKTGIWKHWYSNGMLRKVENWKEGKLHGYSKTFNRAGELVEMKEFKSGVEVLPEDKGFKIRRSDRQEVSDSTSVSDD